MDQCLDLPSFHTISNTTIFCTLRRLACPHAARGPTPLATGRPVSSRPSQISRCRPAGYIAPEESTRLRRPEMSVTSNVTRSELGDSNSMVVKEWTAGFGASVRSRKDAGLAAGDDARRSDTGVQQHRNRVAAVIRHGQVRLAVRVEVPDRNGRWNVSPFRSPSWRRSRRRCPAAPKPVGTADGQVRLAVRVEVPDRNGHGILPVG